ncbi:hypothetical protein AG1IA_06626 [Rhizoctonia solani AG-1 IA]|uniref:Uncharacterized protein n=1 Tax=Thanatephorus cucumeris (strain AG1-IA) TaxID=983506 RepID=L8WSJ3_THACA|nr:hypothetical protein AG1IA_06626 [Rhizoctonia solani AG-1 IA]
MSPFRQNLVGVFTCNLPLLVGGSGQWTHSSQIDLSCALVQSLDISSLVQPLFAKQRWVLCQRSTMQESSRRLLFCELKTKSSSNKREQAPKQICAAKQLSHGSPNSG